MNKEEIVKILKQIALEYAKEFNYKIGHEDKRKSKNKIGMHFFSSDTDEDYYFVQYGTTNKTNYKRNGGQIELRYRFNSPRLDVYLPNRQGFASIEFSNYNMQTKEYDEKWHYSESQIFGEDGINLFYKIYNRFFEILKGSEE